MAQQPADPNELIGQAINQLQAKGLAFERDYTRLRDAIKQHRASVLSAYEDTKLSAYEDTKLDIPLRKAIDQADNRLWSMVFSGKPKTRKTR